MEYADEDFSGQEGMINSIINKVFWVKNKIHNYYLSEVLLSKQN